jgi:hypothetical protein
VLLAIIGLLIVNVSLSGVSIRVKGSTYAYRTNDQYQAIVGEILASRPVFRTKATLSSSSLEEEIKKQLRGKEAVLSTQSSLPNINLSKSYILEKEVLGAMLYDVQLLSHGIQEFSVQDFQNQEIKAIFEDLKLTKNTAILKSSTVAKESLFMVESMLDNLEGNTDALKKDLYKSFSFFKKEAIKRQQIQLEENLRLAESQKDLGLARQIREDFAILTKQRADLEKKLN